MDLKYQMHYLHILRSFTYVKNNRGLSMDPCGTPQVISDKV